MYYMQLSATIFHISLVPENEGTRVLNGICLLAPLRAQSVNYVATDISGG